ncbi:PilX N-terminal domain-containing pilus assembly protein [bacterium]|nr:PilX N-terminal domain-containing pilus assembly protein [bacterium]
MTFKTVRKNSGATLVITLVLLMLVSLLAVAMFRSDTFQSKQLGNTIERDIAFEGAESALVFARTLIDQGISDNDFAAAGDPSARGYYNGSPPGFNDTDERAFWNTYAWADASSELDNDVLGYKVDKQLSARFVIEKHAINCPGYSLKWPAVPRQGVAYRVTSRGSGRLDGANVILQTWYKIGC